MEYRILTQSDIKECLDYDAETGYFVWKYKKSKKVKAGDKAGVKHWKGYIRIKINSVSYAAHRLAWLYTYGRYPEYQIDHINGIKDDNRICNLRKVTNIQNQQNTIKKKNNTSGYKGVTFNKRKNKWVVLISLNKKRIYLGEFLSVEEAANIYKEAADKYHGEYVRQ